MYDVIIIGGGPAGLTAGIYASRRKMKTLIIAQDIGGQATLAWEVDNYPGFMKIKGSELMKNFYEQAKSSGCEFVLDKVVKISEDKNAYKVHTQEKEYETRTVIIACGKSPRELNVPGEEKFKGRGVSYCTICDGPLFKEKIVAVIGGGNSALDASIYLSKLAKKVYLIHRRDKFRGFEHLVDEVKKRKNVELVLDSVVEEIKGENVVNSIVVKNVKTGEKREIEVDGVFVEIGYEIKTDLIKDFVKLDEENQVVINEKCETFYPDGKKRPGVFAAGDITNVPFKQIVIAASQGAIAALQAYNYLHEEEKVFTDFSYR